MHRLVLRSIASLRLRPLSRHPRTALAHPFTSRTFPATSTSAFFSSTSTPVASPAPASRPVRGATLASPPPSLHDDATDDHQPSTPGKPSRPALLKELSRVVELAKDETKLLALGTAGLGVSAGIMMYIPRGFGRVVDIATGAVSGDPVQYAVGLGGLMSVGAVAAFARIWSFTMAGHRLVARLRKRVFDNVLAQEMGFFDRHRTGELINRLSADTVVMSGSLSGTQLSMGIRSVAQGAFALGYMLYLSPKLTAVMLGVVPLAAVGAFTYGKFIKHLSTAVQDALSETTAFAEERLGAIRTVRAFGAEDAERSGYNERVDKVFQLARREALANSAFFSVTHLAAMSAMLGVLAYGGTMVMDGEITAGALTSTLMYTLFLGTSVASVSSYYGELMKGVGASTRVMDLLERLPSIPNGEGRVPERFEGGVTFDGVQFAYPTRADSPVLSDLSVSVAPGQSLALVGGSGSGKSSALSLLLRFYDAQGGAVKIDGQDVREIQPQWIREHVGVVAQEPTLFAASIMDNIRYGRPDASEEDVREAARQANADGFIEAFPDGYETHVGERGAQLSGGQKQRIAIARALIKDPKILVLDEATSALDVESERLVQDALERLMRDHKRTILCVAHRLSTVKNADSIAVLQDGRIAEQGTHDELSQRKDGLYTQLMQL